MLKIKNVISGAVGEELGLKSGDIILKFNDYDADILDYLYFDSCEDFTITVKGEDGISKYDVEKYAEEPLGLEFDESAEIKTAKCKNKCIFCFVDQLPKAMRKTLYVKDDDYRLSFVTGNYITLTNADKMDIERICQRKFSPLYISIHATDPSTRCYMLNNKNAGEILNHIQKLSEAGIIMHCQVVLCPGINGGAVLKNTIKDLYKFYPHVKSVAVVPVGLTKHRDNLTSIKAVSKADAEEAIAICAEYPFFAYCSDEIYIKAEIDLPSYENYGEFEQLENGVGLIKKFENEFYESMTASDIIPKKREIIVATGVSAYPFINGLVEAYKNKYGLNGINVVAIKNNFFGESITVSGLITASDLINGLGKTAEGKEVLISKSMLKEFDNVFLDGIDIFTLEKELKADIKVCDIYGYSFFDALTGE